MKAKVGLRATIETGPSAWTRLSGALRPALTVMTVVGFSFAHVGTVGAVDKMQRAVPKATDGSKGHPVDPTTLPATGEKPAEPVDLKGPKPVIEATELTHDFGQIWLGPVLDHKFEIKNTGDAPLEIKKVKPSCGCTVAGQYPPTIEAGGKGLFPFSISSAKLRGRFEKSITISSNDPVTPDLHLKLRGEVKAYVDVVPDNANFGRVLGQEKQERILNITNNTETPLTLTLDVPADSKFKWELSEKETGKKFELRVTANPPFLPGNLDTTVKLKTNSDKQAEIVVVARANVPERIDVQPQSITVSPPGGQGGDVAAGIEGASRVIRFNNYGEKKVKLLEATSDDPENIKLTMNERTPGEAYTILVQLPKGYAPPAGGKTITLKTDDAEKSTYTIPVTTAERPAVKPTVRPAEAMVGRPAPTFKLTTSDGKSLGNEDLKNHITVLDFFATNCGFCKKQIPRLEPIRKEYADKGVRIITVNQTMRGAKSSDDDVKAKLTELGYGGEWANDVENTVGPLFGASSYPTMVVLSKNGNIEAVNSGNINDLESRLKGQLDALIAGKPLPKVETAEAAPTPPPAAKAPELLGKAAPAFSMETIEKKPVNNAELAKSPATILDFFAVNCGFCKKQIPRLEEIRKKYAEKGVRFITVAEKMRQDYTLEQVQDTLKGLNFAGEVVMDMENKWGQAFNATGFPTMIVLGKSGNVEAINSGNMADLETRLGAQLDALIAGKPVPQIAAAEAPKKPDAPAPAAQPVLVGKPAPAFSTQTVDGKPFANAELSKSAATVVDIFAPNCGYCKKQMPRVETVRKTYADKNVRFVNLAQKMGKDFTKEEIQAVLKETGFQAELVLDLENKIGPMLGSSGFPTMVVLGKSGNIEAINVGNIGDLETRLSAQLDALIAGKPVPVIADAKPAAPAPPESPMGKPAPAIDLTTVDGKPITNAEFAKVPATVLDFFAGNCPHCKHQLPNVEEVRKKYAEKGVRFVAMAQKMRQEYTKEELQEIIKGTGFQGELAMDMANKFGPPFGAQGFPTMVVVGKSGKIEAINVGNMADLQSKLSEQLDALIAGKPIPASALPPVAAAPQPGKRPAEEMVGKKAPEFTLDTLEGKKVASADFGKNTATVLNFVAPNCGYCKKQLPTVEKIREEYEKKGVRFVNVTQTMGKEFSVEEMTKVFAETGSKLELAPDKDNAVGKQYQAMSFPTMVVVSKDGTIAAVNIGAKPDIDAILKGQLDNVVAGKPATPPAPGAPPAPAMAPAAPAPAPKTP